MIDGEGAWRQASPLAAMPDLAPVTWLLQTLGLFFFAGGFAAARSPRAAEPRPALVAAGADWRWPLAGLLGVLGRWRSVIAGAAGTPTATLRTIATLVISPLWFLLPYLGAARRDRPLATGRRPGRRRG